MEKLLANYKFNKFMFLGACVGTLIAFPFNYHLNGFVYAAVTMTLVLGFILILDAFLQRIFE